MRVDEVNKAGGWNGRGPSVVVTLPSRMRTVVAVASFPLCH